MKNNTNVLSCLKVFLLNHKWSLCMKSNETTSRDVEKPHFPVPYKDEVTLHKICAH